VREWSSSLRQNHLPPQQRLTHTTRPKPVTSTSGIALDEFVRLVRFRRNFPEACSVALTIPTGFHAKCRLARCRAQIASVVTRPMFHDITCPGSRLVKNMTPAEQDGSVVSNITMRPPHHHIEPRGSLTSRRAERRQKFFRKYSARSCGAEPRRGTPGRDESLSSCGNHHLQHAC